LGIAGCIKLFI
jgi:hypothetical protein